MARMYDAAAEEKIIDLCAYRSVRALTRAAGGEEMALPHARLAARAQSFRSQIHIPVNL